MEFAGQEHVLLPATTQVPPARKSIRRKNPKAWLSGELIIRCERQHITSLPQQLLLKTTLHKLILTGNELESLPQQMFQQLRELRELCLGHNKLTCIAEDVHQLQRLEVLDLQHNQLQELPASLVKCVHIHTININGNPLCAWLRQLWPEPSAAGVLQEGLPALSAPAGSCDSIMRRPSAAELQHIKANTKTLLDHFLERQDPVTQQEILEARLAALQDTAKAQLKRQRHIVELDSLASRCKLAGEAQLGQAVMSHLQQLQAAAVELQDATQTVLQQQQEQQQQPTAALDDEQAAKMQQQLAACLRKVKELCQPVRPAGALYDAAYSLMRRLHRQQQEHGWRFGFQNPDVEDGCSSSVAGDSGGVSSGQTSSPGPRRTFLTSAVRRRQQLAAQGAKTYQQWVEVKQQQEQQQKQRLKDLVSAEVEGRVHVVAERAAQALENCERERQWPSQRVEAFPPGTFKLDPKALKDVRKAYRRLQLVQ